MPTLRAQAQAAKEKLTDGVQADPRVQAVMSRFPGTQLLEVRRIVPDAGHAMTEPGNTHELVSATRAFAQPHA